MPVAQHVLPTVPQFLGQPVASGVTHDVVIGEHPRRRRSGPGRQGEVVVNDATQLLGPERGLEQVEVEGLPQFLTGCVGRTAIGRHPRLGHGHPGRVVLVEDLPPVTVDVVHLVAVLQTTIARGPVGGVKLRLAGQRFAEILLEQVGDVHPEPVHPAVGPEPQRLVELGDDLGVVPVEVGLGDVEHVQVPLAVVNLLPRRATEGACPVGGWLVPVAEVVELTGGRPGTISQGLAEQLVARSGVVGDDVDDESDPVGVQGVDEPVEVRQGPQSRVDIAVVVDVVAAVGQGRGVEGAQPDGIHAQPHQVVDVIDDSGQVTDPVTIGVGERPRIDLVDDGLAVPVRSIGFVGHGTSFCCRTHQPSIITSEEDRHPGSGRWPPQRPPGLLR